MPCKPFVVETDSGPRVIGWACNRGRRESIRCKCGRPATQLCDYPLTGAKAGQTCDRDLCDGCAVTVGKHGSGPHAGDTEDYCPAHARLATTMETRDQIGGADAG